MTNCVEKFSRDIYERSWSTTSGAVSRSPKSEYRCKCRPKQNWKCDTTSRLFEKTYSRRVDTMLDPLTPMTVKVKPARWRCPSVSGWVRALCSLSDAFAAPSVSATLNSVTVDVCTEGDIPPQGSLVDLHAAAFKGGHDLAFTLGSDDADVAPLISHREGKLMSLSRLSPECCRLGDSRGGFVTIVMCDDLPLNTEKCGVYVRAMLTCPKIKEMPASAVKRAYRDAGSNLMHSCTAFNVLQNTPRFDGPRIDFIRYCNPMCVFMNLLCFCTE